MSKSSNICKICDNDRFENVDGFYYCTVCSAKAESRQDIEAADELIQGGAKIQLATNRRSKQTKRERLLEKEQNSENYSTIQVYNFVLRAQVDDLIRLGCNPIIKKYVLQLWAKYLQKLGLSFTADGKIDETNIKWHRDKNFFRDYKLKLESGNEIVKDDVLPSTSETVGADGIEANDTAADDDDDVDVNEESYENENDYKSEVEEEEQEEEGEKEVAEAAAEDGDDEVDDVNEAKSMSRAIVLTKFECIRMVHTIVIVNLGLLLIKSPIMVTDLIRFVNQGKVSFSNINAVLPQSMRFTYHDDATMFNVKSLPNADHLRYLTVKLGKFLELESINLIDIHQITSRFVIDLNLPFQFIGLVNALMEKCPELIPTKVDFNRTSNNINLEAVSLTYILTVLVVTCIYNPVDYSKNQDRKMKFSFHHWFHQMQNRLTKIGGEIVGMELSEIKCLDDIKTLHYSGIDYRHQNDTKPYISQYRSDVIIEALGLSLKENDTETESNEASLLYITTRKHKELMSTMHRHSIEHLLDQEKILLLTQNYKMRLFSDYCKETILNKEAIGRYLAGVETSTLNWLIDCFQQVSQTHSYHSMYNFLCKLINKIT